MGLSGVRRRTRKVMSRRRRRWKKRRRRKRRAWNKKKTNHSTKKGWEKLCDRISVAHPLYISLILARNV